ncbi:hypothetical protein SDC9_183054 [bioreactor metagenome]|uniref:Uncharacterized protein n=1 Tax=bioreactor metagenome TaxID=1076179 RepID=A0A645HAL3_9ZZZZ
MQPLVSRAFQPIFQLVHGGGVGVGLTGLQSADTFFGRIAELEFHAFEIRGHHLSDPVVGFGHGGGKVLVVDPPAAICDRHRRRYRVERVGDAYRDVVIFLPYRRYRQVSAAVFKHCPGRFSGPRRHVFKTQAGDFGEPVHHLDRHSVEAARLFVIP